MLSRSLLKQTHRPLVNGLLGDYRVRTVILDWSGTLVDTLVKAPAVAFMDVFKAFGVPITMTEAREPMGNHKKVHIQRITENPKVRARWVQKYGRDPNADDVNQMFNMFVPQQLKALDKYGDPLPGAVETCQLLKDHDIRLGLTTGFNRLMVDKLLKMNRQLQWALDVTVAADEVPIARPAPYMIYKNLERLQEKNLKMPLFDRRTIIKVDDTEMGIQEGVHAGVWTVGLSRHSNLMGNFTDDVDTYEKEEPIQYSQNMTYIKDKLSVAGANYVIDDITKLPAVIEKINKRINMLC